MTNKQMAYLPMNLDIDSLLKHPEAQELNLEKDKLLYILHLLTEANILKDAKGTKMIPLNATMLQKAGIRDFPKYRDFLLKHNVIETDGFYIVGKKSRGFRFHKNYQVPFFSEYTIHNRGINRNINKRKQTSMNNILYHKELFKWFNSDLQIDVAKATLYAYISYRSNLYELELSSKLDKERMKYGDTPLSMEEIKRRNELPNKLFNKCASSMLSIQKISHGNFFFIVDNTSGRLHTNLTSLKSDLRNFLTYQGKQLVSFDFKNSQPMLSTLLFSNKFWEGDLENFFGYNYISHSKSGKGKHKDEMRFMPNTPRKTKSFKPKTISFLKYNGALKSKDIEEYIRHSSNGKFYEYILDELIFRYPSLGANISSRKELKRILFIVLFTDNRFISQKDAEPKRIFRKLFPEVYKLLKHIKRNKSNKLAILLQIIESKLVLWKIAKRISKEYPHIPIFTIHDSVTTTVENKDIVRRILLEESEKLLGFAPPLSVEYWDEQNLNKNKSNDEIIMQSQFRVQYFIELLNLNYSMSLSQPMDYQSIIDKAIEAKLTSEELQKVYEYVEYFKEQVKISGQTYQTPGNAFNMLPTYQKVS